MSAPTGPSRQRSALTTIVIVLAFALTIAGVAAAGRPTAPGAAISGYLPGQPTTRLHADVTTGEAWQVNQGVLPAAAAWDELSLLARRHLEPIAAGHWLTVDLLDPAQPAARLSLDFQVDGDTVSLRSLTTPERSLSLDPGIPVLDPGMLDGADLAWEGTLGRDDSEATAATAAITSEAIDDLPGCLETQVSIDNGTEIFTWCSGEEPGLAGWQSQSTEGAAGFTPVASPRGDVGNAVDLDETPATALAGEPVRQVQFFRIASGSYREQIAPRGSRVTWAADQLVIADTEGRVTSWLPIDDESPDSYYSQVWRTQPGGSIRAIVSVGAVTVLGTTEREVIAYDRDGWELWRHPVSDGVTQMSVLDGLVVAADASGSVTVLDPLTGAERWHTTGVTEIVATGGTPGSVVVLSGASLTVHELATGAVTWSVEVDPRTTAAAAAGTQIAIATGNWMTLRDAGVGSVRSARAVPSDLLLARAGDHLLVSEPRTARLLDDTGRAVWVSAHPMPTVIPLGDDGAVLAIQLDALVLAGPGFAELTWAYPDGVGEPDLEPVRGDQGIVTVQLLGGQYRWWEYR